MNVSSFLCQVCNQNKSNYTCPRCNAMYCTLQCYKKHDEQCTTQFYNDHVMDCIKNEKSTKQESIDMAKKLKSFYNQQMKEDEERDKIIYQQKLNDQLLNENMEKLQKLALNDKIDINDLTQYQQKEFLKAIKKGQLHKHINVWSPWWLKNTQKNNNNNIIISETDVFDDDDNQNNNDNDNDNKERNICLIIPSLPIDIPSFKSIHAKSPSPLLPYLLCDILCGYVGAMIKYNGDWNDEPSQVLQLILSISCVLPNKQCIHNDFNQLTNKLMENYASQSIKNNKFEILLYLKQVCMLLMDKVNVLRALNQIYELIEIIQSQIVKTSKVSKSLNKKIKKLQRKDEKKKVKKVKEIKEITKNNYYDDHADNFINLMNVEQKTMDNDQQNNNNKLNKTKKPENVHCYTSSFAPEKMRKDTRKKCKKLEPIKRKIWFYLVWWNEYISNEKANLLSTELKIIVEHIHSKCTKMDDQIKLTMFN